MANKVKTLLQPLKLLTKPAAILLSIARKKNATSIELDPIKPEQERSTPPPRKQTGKRQNSASVSIAASIIDGKIDLSSLDIRTYPQLEETWLADVKRLKAYYVWETGNSLGEETDYYSAVNEIREHLLSMPAKNLDRFDRIEHYLTKKYFRIDGSLAERKQAMEDLIRRKAQRIYEVKQEANPARNWARAKLYVRLFYENIIPAIQKKSETSTLAVLKAFQFSKSPRNRFLIINAFEAALAINFLNKKVVAKIVDHPDLFDFSMEPVDNWPAHFTTPPSCKKQFRLHKEDKVLVFDGIMSVSQRNALLGNLNMREHKKAIEELFEQSQLKLFSGTLL